MNITIFTKQIWRKLAMASQVFLLQACISEGDITSSSFFNIGTDWQEGVFQNESFFKNSCQVPREGIDPFTNEPYLDQLGQTLDENNWLRSWSNNTYLWYDEIVDLDPSLFDDPIAYFNLLKTFATTASGRDRDQFHFTIPSDEWFQRSQAGASAGYGARFSIIQSRPPREIRVAYTEPGSEAASNLSRGTEILSVDGVDIVNNNTDSGINIINEGIFPDNNSTHQFTVRDVGSSVIRSITMTSSIVTSTPVQLTSNFISAGGSNIGYFLFNSHNRPSEEGLINAVTQLQNQNIDELVIDLRYNGGGFLAIASQLSYMIAGSSATQNRTFDRLVFNDKHLDIDPVTGRTLAPTPFIDQSIGFSVNEGQALPTLNLSRVFILSTEDTCSASEAIINSLRGINLEVVLIGSTTCGKPYGFYATDNCGTTYFTVQFRGENDKGFGDYSDGFSPLNTPGPTTTPIPGCYIEDDFQHQLGDQQEELLVAAVNYMQTGTCPAVPATSGFKNNNLSKQGLSLQDSSRYQKHIFLERNSFINK